MGQRITGREWEAQGESGNSAETFRQHQITIDGVIAPVHARDLVVEPARAFSSIAHSEDHLRTTDFCDEPAPQQSLKIDSGVGPERAGLHYPGEEITRSVEPSELGAREDVDMIDVWIAAQKRRPFGINDPGDLCLCIRLANQRHRRQGVDDIAQRTGLDDQDRFDG